MKGEGLISAVSAKLYGHSDQSCASIFRYVKYGESHDTNPYKKERDQTPECANFGEQHTAHYRGLLFNYKNAPLG
jgi:hypothetical protein